MSPDRLPPDRPPRPGGQRRRLAAKAARPRSMRRIPGWVWLAAAVVFVPALLYWIDLRWGEHRAPRSSKRGGEAGSRPASRGEAEPPPVRVGAPELDPERKKRLDAYPELKAADPEACARIRGALIHDYRWDRAKRPKAVVEAVESAGHRGALALLKVMFEQAPPNSCGAYTVSYPNQDENTGSLSRLLREHATAELDPVLLRMVRDGALFHPLRSNAIIALCRPGNTSAVEPLVRIAQDRKESDTLRHAILLRLPRVGVPLLHHLRSDLYRPFFDVDQATAVAVALAGELEAPSLLLEVLGEVSHEQHLGGSVVEALLRVTGRDPGVVAAVKRLMPFFEVPRALKGTRKQDRTLCADAADALAAAFEEWLDAHPDARETEFERRRAAYLESPQRKREEAVRTFEDILALDEAELDLAAAALVCERDDKDEQDAGYRRKILERLFRFSALLKDDIRGLDNPEAVITAVNRRLYSTVMYVQGTWQGDGLPTMLSDALTGHAVSCVGGTLLWLALGERLGLPLHAVRSPGHVFVRWDDGTTRRNIETTSNGAEFPDEHYHAYEERVDRKVTPQDLAAGRYLRNLTRKETLASLASNLSRICLESPFLEDGGSRYEKARIFATRAIRLNPELPFAFLNRAWANARLGEPADRILEDVRTAMGLDGGSGRAQVWAGRIHEQLGRHREALGHYRRALADRPDGSVAQLGRIRCLLALGRVARALELAEARLKKEPDLPETGRLRLEALVRLRDPRWPEALEKLLLDSGSRPEALLLLVARLLLRAEPDREPEPARAIALLDRIKDHPRANSKGATFIQSERRNGALLFVRKDTAVAIERERDELRARAKAMLDTSRTGKKANR